MTWQEFKAAAEQAGMTDSTNIWYVDYQGTSAQLSVQKHDNLGMAIVSGAAPAPTAETPAAPPTETETPPESAVPEGTTPPPAGAEGTEPEPPTPRSRR
jgi:hypothetical protein